MMINFRGKIFAGDLAKADQSSSASILGNLDPRMELDRNINPDNEKYFGSISIMASKLSYENEDFIKNIVHNHWKVIISGLFCNDGPCPYNLYPLSHSAILKYDD